MSGSNTTIIKDHNGKEFKSIYAMCKYHGILLATFRARQQRGRTLEECLRPNYSYYDKTMHCKKVQDHNGVTFNSITAMCNYYGIKVQTYKTRLRLGLSTEAALTLPVRNKKNNNSGDDIKNEE